MVFANREDFFKSTDPNDVVLDGNLSPFEGAYSNDAYERKSPIPVLNFMAILRRVLPKQDQRLSKHCKW